MNASAVEPRRTPSSPEPCLVQSRKARYRGGTLIAADVVNVTEHERRLLGLSPGEASPTLYRPGNEASGYRGRTGIYELIGIDEAMRTMIHDGASEQEMERHARYATASIRDDGLAKVLGGVTTIEEVLRVTRED